MNPDQINRLLSILERYVAAYEAQTRVAEDAGMRLLGSMLGPVGPLAPVAPIKPTENK